VTKASSGIDQLIDAAALQAANKREAFTSQHELNRTELN